MINELAKQIHEGNKKRGFYEGEKNIGEMLCLIHSELSEALEADRNGVYSLVEIKTIRGWVDDNAFKTHYIETVKGSFEEELADIIIRVLDLCAFKNIDIESHIKAKMRFNSLRPYKHGKKY